VILPQEDIWQYLETALIVAAWAGALLLTSSSYSPEALLNVLKGPEIAPHNKEAFDQISQQ